MKDFFDTWKFKILVGIAVFLVGIMAYAGANGRLTAAPQELLSVAAAPFQKVAAVVSGGVASLWEKYTSIDDVMAENETLKAENAELRQQMVDYDRVKAENQAYKALESIQSQRPEMSYLSSFVIGRDPLDSFYGLRWTAARWMAWPSTMPWSVTKATCWAWWWRLSPPAAR